MKKLIFILSVTLLFAACSSSEKEESGPSYEEKATKAISEYTKAKEVKSVKLIQEISAEEAKSELAKYDSAVILYEDAIKSYGSAIESYQSAKESYAKIDQTYAAYLGTSTNLNYDSLILNLEAQIEDSKAAITDIKNITTQLKALSDKHKDKSPYAVFGATIDGIERKFAVSPDGDDVKVLFEM